MRIGTCLGTVVLVASLSPCAGRAQQGIADDETAIRALIQKTQDANNAGDVEAWVSLFAEDAVYMPPGAPAVTTRKGLVEIAKAGFRNRASITIEPLEIRVFGDWAFARSRVTGSVRLHDRDEVVPVDVKQLVIYSRGADGAWRIARLINNSNAS